MITSIQFRWAWTEPVYWMWLVWASALLGVTMTCFYRTVRVSRLRKIFFSFFFKQQQNQKKKTKIFNVDPFFESIGDISIFACRKRKRKLCFLDKFLAYTTRFKLYDCYFMNMMTKLTRSVNWPFIGRRRLMHFPTRQKTQCWHFLGCCLSESVQVLHDDKPISSSTRSWIPVLVTMTQVLLSQQSLKT